MIFNDLVMKDLLFNDSVIVKNKMKTRPLSLLASYVLLLSPILQIYGWGRYDFALISSLILTTIYFMKNGINNNMPKWLTIYLAYCVFALGISIIGGSRNFPIFTIRVLVTYLMFWGAIELKDLLKAYKIIGFICIVFFFFQYIVLLLTNHYVNGVITFLPIAFTDDYATFYSTLLDSHRCASFFSEPAHLAQFLLPLLCVELMFDKAKNHFVYSGVIIVVLLLLSSGNAMMGLAAIFLVYVGNLLFRKPSVSKIFLFIVALLAVAIGGYYFMQTEAGAQMMERSEELNYSDATNFRSSGYLRMYRGYAVYSEYSPSEKIFGIYDNELIQRKINSSIMAAAFYDDDMYFNGVQNILIRTGLIGALIFSILIITLWRGNHISSKAILLVLVVFCFIASIYLTEAMALCLLLADKIKNNNKWYLVYDRAGNSSEIKE